MEKDRKSTLTEEWEDRLERELQGMYSGDLRSVKEVVKQLLEEREKEMFTKDELQTILFLIDKYEEKEFDKGWGIEGQFWRIRNKIRQYLN